MQLQIYGGVSYADILTLLALFCLGRRSAHWHRRVGTQQEVTSTYSKKSTRSTHGLPAGKQRTPSGKVESGAKGCTRHCSGEASRQDAPTHGHAGKTRSCGASNSPRSSARAGTSQTGAPGCSGIIPVGTCLCPGMPLASNYHNKQAIFS